MLISFHSPFIFYDIYVGPWTNSDVLGFYFRQRSPGGAQPTDCVSQPSPLPELWKLLLSSFRRAHYCCCILRGLFPELLSPFRANSLLSLVGHRVVGMSSVILSMWIRGKPWVSSWQSWVLWCCLGCFAFLIPLSVLLYFYVYKLYIYKINKEVSVENKSLLREGKMTLNWQLYRRYDAFDWLVVKEM